MYKTILIIWLTNWNDNWIVQETEININVFKYFWETNDCRQVFGINRQQVLYTGKL